MKSYAEVIHFFRISESHLKLIVSSFEYFYASLAALAHRKKIIVHVGKLEISCDLDKNSNETMLFIQGVNSYKLPNVFLQKIG